MKRIGLFVGLGALILGSAAPALAQAPPATNVLAGNINVNFGGQMRVYGFAFDNTTDFTNTRPAAPGQTTKTGGACAAASNAQCKDSADFFFQRFRLFTTMESADKKAGAYWALEIGDIIWGQSGGASGSEFNACGRQVANGGPNSTASQGPCANSGGNRTGNGAGGALGADGVNVETKNIYLWFEVPGIPNSKLLAGIHDVLFLVTAAGGFFDDDAPGLQFTWKGDPIDVVAEWARFTDHDVTSSKKNDAYIARLGVNITPDTRVTLEGMLMNEQCLAGDRAATPPATAAPCVKTAIGNTFWIGSTGATKLGDIQLSGAFVYGQRELACPTCNPGNPAKATAKESGYGFIAHALVPVGPISVYGDGWYASGDKNRPLVGVAGGNQTSNATLVKNSDRLPSPEAGSSWGNGSPFVAEWVMGLNTIGAPQVGSTNYLDIGGTWGVGGSALYALTPTFSFGGGVAIVGASETKAVCPTGGTSDCPAGQGNIWGDHVIEFDTGFIHKFNANLTITGIGSFQVPDKGDDAWGLAIRTQYAF